MEEKTKNEEEAGVEAGAGGGGGGVGELGAGLEVEIEGEDAVVVAIVEMDVGEVGDDEGEKAENVVDLLCRIAKGSYELVEEVDQSVISAFCFPFEFVLALSPIAPYVDDPILFLFYDFY